MTNQEMRARVKEMYPPTSNWSDRVSQMHDRQVYMIFNNAKKPGGRLDENLRKTLVDICKTREAKEHIKSLPAWEIYERYQALERDIPPKDSPDYIMPARYFHQLTFDELGVKKDG